MSAPQAACLVRIRNGPFVRAHIIVGPEFIIGRSPEVNVPIVSNTISRKHLKVEIFKDSIRVTDLRSNNGTYVDGIPLTPEKPMTIQPVNRIRLGESEEEISFLAIPVPVEMQEGQKLKTTLQVSLMQAQREIEETALRSVEEQKKAAQAALALEREQSRHQLQNEAAERLRYVEIRQRESIESAQKEAQNIVSRAKQEASQIQSQGYAAHAEKKRELEAQLEKLQNEAAQIITGARNRAAEEEKRMLARAKAEARAEVDSTHQKCELIIKAAQEKYEEKTSVLGKAVAEQQEKNRQLDAQIAKLQAESNQILEKTRARADEEQSKLLASAKAHAKSEIDSSHQRAEATIRAAQEKYTELIIAGEKESKLRLERAQKEASELIQRTRYDGQVFIEATRKQAQALIDDANKSVQAQAEEYRRQAMDSVRIAALEEQEAIVKQFRTTIDQLRATRDKLEPEVRTYTLDVGQLEKRKLNMSVELTTMDRHVVEKRQMLSHIQTELDHARKLITDAEAAEKLRREGEAQFFTLKEKSDADLTLIKSTLDELKTEHKRVLQEQDVEVKEMKEKKLLEFKSFEKSLDDELVQKRLKGLEKLRAAIQDEEIKYKESLALRSLEIAKSIETRLLPAIEAAAKIKGVDFPLEAALEPIRAAVDQVLLKEKPSIQAVTEGMGVNPEAVAKSRKRVKRWASVTAAACAIALTLYGNDLFEYLRKLAKEHNYADMIVAARVAESIYTPAQSDDWRETYSGNILYLRNYYEAKTDKVYEKQWTLRLHDLEFIRSLGINEDDMAAIIGKEAALVQRLWKLRQAIDARYLDEGLAKLNEAEVQTLNEIRTILKNDDDQLQKFRRLERDFTVAYLKRRFAPEQRVPTSN